MADGKTGKNIGKQGLPVLNVGNPGNSGGSGRPPSAIRARCRGSFDARIPVAESIADDPNASASDRLRAIDVLAKYGLPLQVENETGFDLTPEQREARIAELEAKRAQILSRKTGPKAEDE